MKHAKCHPDRLYWAKDQCHQCYIAAYYRQHRTRILKRHQGYYLQRLNQQEIADGLPQDTRGAL